jgi:hypothetical protein
MNRLFKTVMVATVAVLAFDTIGALAARFIGFSYGALAAVSWLIPTGAGFFSTKGHTLFAGILAGALVGFVDATVGWMIASAVAVGTSMGDLTLPQVARTILLVTGMSGLFGLAGGLAAKGMARWRQTQPTSTE